jgi:hypothetical protein
MNTEIIEKVKYNGRVYNALPFTNESRHVEPCCNCAFGTPAFICNKPADFPSHCTCISREDGKNVYFVTAQTLREYNSENKALITYRTAYPRLARVEHKCALCGEAIRIKEQYQDVFVRTDDKAYQIKTHNHCYTVAKVLDLEIIADDNEPLFDSEDIKEYVRIHYPYNTRVRYESSLRKIVEKIWRDIHKVTEIKEPKVSTIDN